MFSLLDFALCLLAVLCIGILATYARRAFKNPGFPSSEKQKGASTTSRPHAISAKTNADPVTRPNLPTFDTAIARLQQGTVLPDYWIVVALLQVLRNKMPEAEARTTLTAHREKNILRRFVMAVADLQERTIAPRDLVEITFLERAFPSLTDGTSVTKKEIRELMARAARCHLGESLRAIRTFEHSSGELVDPPQVQKAPKIPRIDQQVNDFIASVEDTGLDLAAFSTTKEELYSIARRAKLLHAQTLARQVLLCDSASEYSYLRLKNYLLQAGLEESEMEPITWAEIQQAYERSWVPRLLDIMESFRRFRPGISPLPEMRRLLSQHREKLADARITKGMILEAERHAYANGANVAITRANACRTQDSASIDPELYQLTVELLRNRHPLSLLEKTLETCIEAWTEYAAVLLICYRNQAQLGSIRHQALVDELLAEGIELV